VSMPLYDQAQRLGSHAHLQGASIATNENWHYGLYLSFFTGARYYGLLNGPDFAGQLQRNNVKYLVLWKDSKPNDYLAEYQKVYEDSVSGLLLYERR
jgi:hypothetical protein